MYQQRSEGEDTMLKCFPSWTISTHFYRAENSCSLTLRLSCVQGILWVAIVMEYGRGLCFQDLRKSIFFDKTKNFGLKTLHFRGQNESRHVFGSGVSPGFVETLAFWLTSCRIYLWLAMSPARISLGRHKRPLGCYCTKTWNVPDQKSEQ